MIRYLLIPIWAALQIGFSWLFLGIFLPKPQRREENGWILALAWLFCTVYGFFPLHGIYGYLMYLLAVVVMLLSLFGEFGPRGLCLLMFTVLIPVAIDMAAEHLLQSMGGWLYFFGLTAAKALPLGLALALRKLVPRRADSSLSAGEQDALLRQHMEMQRESMQALEQNYRLQRKSTHEFEHHMQVLRDLLDQNEVAAAQDYLARLRKNRSIHIMSVQSGHPVIDVILNQKHQTAQENGIRMQLQVNDLSMVRIPTDSLVVLLTNLLDNALEACRRLDGYREILCSVLQDDGLYISIRNTSDPVRILDGQIPTSKTDSLSHGFGLLSVTHVLDELGAEYTFGYEDGWFHFAAEIDV